MGGVARLGGAIALAAALLFVAAVLAMTVPGEHVGVEMVERN
jgi:hypothetical protein